MVRGGNSGIVGSCNRDGMDIGSIKYLLYSKVLNIMSSL